MIIYMKPSPANPTFLWGLVNLDVNIEGFKIHASREEFLTASGRKKEWFVLDAGTHWLLWERLKANVIPKKKRWKNYNPKQNIAGTHKIAFRKYGSTL